MTRAHTKLHIFFARGRQVAKEEGREKRREDKTIYASLDDARMFLFKLESTSLK